MWISMLTLTNYVFVEYKFFGCEYEHQHEYYRQIYNIFVTLKWSWGLTYIMPRLEAMHAPIKFAQSQDCLVCDFITFVKTCCAELYNMHYNMEKKCTYE
jgi:hypothetical protein